PQQDILAHHNVKAFVSHCGLSGTQEAMYNGVPIVGFPITWEHIKTAMSLEAAGVGIHLSWSSVTEDALENAIKEVMSNPSYRQNMAALSRRYRDQPETPLDRAVYWTEYVARYRGAPHLQSPTKKMSLVQILGIDIIACLFLIL
ncbi:UDP-glucuronosyl/UDP-glucosyltransferase, partial [Trinorchestia longiramus]